MKGYIYNHILYDILFDEKHNEYFIGNKGILGENSIHINWGDITKYLEKKGYEITKK